MTHSDLAPWGRIPSRPRGRARPDHDRVHARDRAADGPGRDRDRRQPAAHGRPEAPERARRRCPGRRPQLPPVNNTKAIANTLVARDYTRVNYPGKPNANVPDPTPAYACLIGLDHHRAAPGQRHAPGVQRLLCREQPRVEVHDRRVLGAVGSGAPPDRRAQHGRLLTSRRHPALLLRACGRRQQRQHGVITSAACTGVCGSLPLAPVDVVILLDRTGSMDDSASVDNLRAGARAALQALRSRAAADRPRVSPPVPDPDDERQLRQLRLVAPDQLDRRTDQATRWPPHRARTPAALGPVHAIAIDPDYLRPATSRPTSRRTPTRTWRPARIGSRSRDRSASTPTTFCSPRSPSTATSTPDADRIRRPLSFGQQLADDPTAAPHRGRRRPTGGSRPAATRRPATGPGPCRAAPGRSAGSSRYTGVDTADPIDSENEDEGTTSAFERAEPVGPVDPDE